MTQEEKMQREQIREALKHHTNPAGDPAAEALEAARKKFLESESHKREVFNAGEKAWARRFAAEGLNYTKRTPTKEALDSVHPVC